MISGEQLIEVAHRLRTEGSAREDVGEWMKRRELDSEGVGIYAGMMFSVMRSLAAEDGLERAAIAMLVYSFQVGVVVGEGGVDGEAN